MSRWRWCLVWGLVLWGGALTAQAQEEAERDASRLALGVAPFESKAPPGTAVPDLATLLADRLGTRGLERVVGPSQLGAPPVADPAPKDVRTWAKQARVQGVLVGRTTRIGGQLSVDVRLRSGKTGEVARTFVEEVSRPELLEAAIERLAGQVIAGGLELWGLPAVAAKAGPGGRPASPAKRRGSVTGQLPGSGGTPFAFGTLDSKKPLSIESDELDAIQQDGMRRLVFRKNVRVKQGELSMTSALLEAVYPAEASQPDRLVASGGVRMQQGKQNARCQKVIYDRVKDRITCQGQAVVHDGDNRLTGDVIEIDLRSEKVSVKGGASILIQPETFQQLQQTPAAQAPPPQPPPQPKAEAAEEPS